MQKVKQAIRRGAAGWYYRSGLYNRANRGKVMILMYHRVLSDREVKCRYIQPGMYVLKNTFDKQVEFLKAHYEIISLGELLSRWKEKVYDSGSRYCVITFDDGWRDNYTYAYPVLKKYNVPATIFLVTDLVGTAQWCWPERLCYLLEQYHSLTLNKVQKTEIVHLLEQYLGGYKMPDGPGGRGEWASENQSIEEVINRCKELASEAVEELIERIGLTLNLSLPGQRLLLNWDEIAEMSRSGVSFGSHSRSHRILTRLPLGEVEAELEESRKVIEDRHINYVPAFCYPNGNYNKEIQRLVRGCGYHAAVSTRCGAEGRAPEDLFAIRRVGIHDDVSSTVPMFALQLSYLHKTFSSRNVA